MSVAQRMAVVFAAGVAALSFAAVGVASAQSGHPATTASTGCNTYGGVIECPPGGGHPIQ